MVRIMINPRRIAFLLFKIHSRFTLEAEFGGIAKDPYGQTRAGFDVSGKISRQEFGLTWNALTEAGGAVVSDEVKFQANVQYVKG